MNAPSTPRPAARRPTPGVRDLTTGPISRTLFTFALPTLGSNVLQSLNGSINAIWVGRFLGEEALAATSNANLTMFLMFALGFGFGMAATILVGQRIGARDIDGARRAMGTGLGLFAILSLIIAVAGWFSAPALLHLLATPAGAQAYALAYLRVIFLALPPMLLGLFITTCLRGTGDSVTPLRLMILNVILDAGLNPLLIRGYGPLPEMGIAGSAMATLIANYTILIVGIVYIYRKDLPIRLRGHELRYIIPDRRLLHFVFVRGISMGLQMLIMSLSGLFMIGLVNREGVEITAAYGVAQQLWGYVQMPAMAIGAAVSAMAAQNIGAGKWDRVGKITRAGVQANLVLTGGMVALLLLFDTPAMALFLGSGSPAIPVARHIQYIASWSFVLFGVTMVLFATVRANGATLGPLLILAFGIAVGRVGLAWALRPYFGQDMLWWASSLSSGWTMVLAILYYRYGNWRKKMVGPRPSREELEEEACADGEPGGRLNPSA